MLGDLSLFRRWIAALLLPATLLAWGPVAAQTLHVRSALTQSGDALGTAPAAGAPVLPVALPDEWSRTRPGFDGIVWYRVTFERPAAPVDGSLLSLAIERVCSSFEVYLNGGLIHGGGRMAPPLTNNCHHPQLVDLPTALLRPGTNTIELKVAGHRREEVGSRWRAGGLSALAIAPHAEVEAWHARRTAAAVGFPMGASATLMLLGVFMFALGFVHRRQSQLAYFGALAVAYALLDARLWLRQPFLDHQAFELLLLVLLGLVTWTAVQFLLRTAGLRSQLADLGLPVQCAAIVLGFVLAGPERSSLAAQVWHAVLALEIAVAVVVHVRQVRRDGERPSRTILLLVGASALSAALQFAGQWTELPALAALAAPLLLPVALVLVGLGLAQQLGRALQAAEQTRQQLEQQIRSAAGEIERNFRQMVDLKVEQVIERERKRIAADLHDDLGAKLLTRRGSGAVLGFGGVDARVERPHLRADDAHPARGHQQHHQAQQRHALHGALRHRRRRLPARHRGQRRRHRTRGRGPARPRPRPGQHEEPRQAAAGAVPGRIGSGLRHRDTAHASAGSRGRAVMIAAGAPIRFRSSSPAPR